MMSENKGTKDAKFEDGAERAVSLKAYDADGLLVISTLIQDAVFPSGSNSMAGAIAGIRGFVKSVSVGGCGNRAIHRARIGTGAILAGGFRRFIRIVKIAGTGRIRPCVIRVIRGVYRG